MSMTQSEGDEPVNKKPTSSSRFASGHAFTKLLMFPFAIQSDIIANRVSDIVTPMRGRTFGCRRAFHTTASLQNLCMQSVISIRARGTDHIQQLTPITLCNSLFEYILMTFTATSRPQCSPFHTSANPPLYIALPVRSKDIGVFKAVGRSAWRPHILHSDLRQFSRVCGERSGLSSAW